MVSAKYQIERTIKPQQLIETMRGYLAIDARWQHQGRWKSEDGKEARMDCVGLFILAMRDLGIEIPDIVGYGRLPNGELEKMIANVCQRIDEPVNGCLLLVFVRREPQHIGLFVNDGKYSYPTMIHASAESGIVEVSYALNSRWRDRTVSYWLLPAIAY